MTYRVRGLSAEPFRKLYGLADTELAEHGVHRYRVDACPGFPDRIEMRDMEPGETALLLNFAHMDLPSPYRSRHAIFVREGAETAYDQVGVVPDVMKRRMISLRAFDARGFMLDADLAEGAAIEALILRFFACPDVSFLHAHNAGRGCFSGLIERG